MTRRAGCPAAVWPWFPAGSLGSIRYRASSAPVRLAVKAFLRPALAVGVAASILVLAPQARADVSSWMFTGGGISFVEQEGLELEHQGLLRIEAGLGTPPSRSFVFGGMFGTRTHFGLGTDMALSVRGASHGFVNGDWGLAVDLGAYQRFFGVDSTGFTGSLVGGAPWGITALATAGFGTNDAREYSFTVGIDFARLTVYRRSGENWWRNPFPAYRPEEE